MTSSELERTKFYVAACKVGATATFILPEEKNLKVILIQTFTGYGNKHMHTRAYT